MINFTRPVVLIGHPYASIGMGEQIRACLESLLAAGVPAKVYDVFKHAPRNDAEHRRSVGPHEVHSIDPHAIKIFHINGNEVLSVLKKIERDEEDFSGTSIISPAWELPNYPTEWTSLVNRFVETWAISHYVEDVFKRSGINVSYTGQSVESPLRYFYPRKYFGLRESAFILLNFFDTTSYATRKNPLGVVDLYRRIRARRPYADIQLVLKVKNGEQQDPAWEKILREEAPDALVVSSKLSTLETRSMIAASDCLVSLHRAEGFGRGTGEAMYFGRLALGTAWSGNMDYMTDENSLLVRCSQIPVQENEYPHWENQHWADPDIDHALYLLERTIDDSHSRRAIERAAASSIMTCMGHRAVGLRMRRALEKFS